MFRFALHKPIIVTVAILIVCIFGILAFFRVPVQMIPDLDPRVISVETRWAGASPQDIEKEILIEQEEYLRRIPGLTRMIATARTGRAEIELEFPHGADINEALIRGQQRRQSGTGLSRECGRAAHQRQFLLRQFVYVFQRQAAARQSRGA